MPLQTLAQQWDTFRRDVIPKNAPPEQLRECRRAFYAGVTAMYAAMVYSIGADDEVTEEAGHAYLEAIGREIDAFKKAVAAGLS